MFAFFFFLVSQKAKKKRSHEKLNKFAGSTTKYLIGLPGLIFPQFFIKSCQIFSKSARKVTRKILRFVSKGVCFYEVHCAI